MGMGSIMQLSNIHNYHPRPQGLLATRVLPNFQRVTEWKWLCMGTRITQLYMVYSYACIIYEDKRNFEKIYIQVQLKENAEMSTITKSA